MAYEAVEDFFLNRIDVGRIFEFTERSEYLFLYHIRQCMERTGGDKAYMSDVAASMKLSVIETSRAVKTLEDKGFVSWQTDENKERTFVTLTGKAKEAMRRQNDKMARAYRRITSEIPEDELVQTVTTLGKIREIVRSDG